MFDCAAVTEYVFAIVGLRSPARGNVKALHDRFTAHPDVMKHAG